MPRPAPVIMMTRSLMSKGFVMATEARSAESRLRSRTTPTYTRPTGPYRRGMGRPGANQLGAFLRARRARVQPGDHGMPTPPNRRTPGLRREDVAVLAGVSTDYYVRLEQGRERHPSPQVIHALAGALCLDADARSHLHDLVRPTPPSRRRRAVDRVEPRLLTLINSWRDTPAQIL